MKEEVSGGRKLHRSAEEMKGSRELKPLLKSRWYKPRRGGQQKTTVKELPHRMKFTSQPKEERATIGRAKRRMK